MANGNRGIGGFMPFPTFGGPKDAGGITPVKLAPTQMRFPTARGPVRRTPEPETIEKIAPFLPLVTEGVMSLFKDTPKPQSRDDYLKSIAVDATEPTKLEEARADAYTLFGAPEQRDGFGLNELVNLAVGSQTGRGAKDFANTYFQIRKGKEAARVSKEGQRASFIQKQIDPDAFQFLNLQDTNKAKTGVVDIRPGYFEKETGQTYIKDPKNKEANEYGFIVAGENWIDPAKLATSGSTGVDIYKDPQYTELMKTNTEITAKDSAVMGTLNVANNTIEMLDEAIKDPSKAPTTVVSSILNMGNSAIANFDQIASLNGNRDPLTYFSADDAGGSMFIGRGDNARELYIALKSGDEEQIERATANFENATGTNLRQVMGQAAYANVATRANFLQLAYMAAAANGQTGRTLSDKDLAHHLNIVGFGSTQDPKVLKDNLIRFVDTLVGGADDQTQVAIPRNGLQRYNMNDETFQSIVTMYYNPLIGKDASGADTPQWLNHSAYTYKPFYERYKGVGAVDQWQKHDTMFYDRKTKGSANLTSPVNPSVDLDKTLKDIENLY